MPGQRRNIPFFIHSGGKQYEESCALLLLSCLLWSQSLSLYEIGVTFGIKEKTLQNAARKIAKQIGCDSQEFQDKAIAIRNYFQEKPYQILLYNAQRNVISLEKAQEIISPTIKANHKEIENRKAFFKDFALDVLLKNDKKMEYIGEDAVIALCGILQLAINKSELAYVLGVPFHKVRNMSVTVMRTVKRYESIEDFQNKIAVRYRKAEKTLEDAKELLCKRFPNLEPKKQTSHTASSESDDMEMYNEPNFEGPNPAFDSLLQFGFFDTAEQLAKAEKELAVFEDYDWNNPHLIL